MMKGQSLRRLISRRASTAPFNGVNMAQPSIAGTLALSRSDKTVTTTALAAITAKPPTMGVPVEVGAAGACDRGGTETGRDGCARRLMGVIGLMRRHVGCRCDDPVPLRVLALAGGENKYLTEG